MARIDTSLLSRQPIPADERLIVALDFPSGKAALQLVDDLGDAVRFYKIGHELFVSYGLQNALEQLLERGKQVLVDLKLSETPRTVEATVRQLHGRDGRVFVTFLAENPSTLEAAHRARDGIKIMAVTVLTSQSREDLVERGLDPTQDVEDRVLFLAEHAIELRADGLISSALEAPRLRERLGFGPIIMCPGIRPADAGVPGDDQKRAVTPEAAFLHGADYIIVGRPVTQAEDPKAAVERIQQTIRRLPFPSGA